MDETFEQRAARVVEAVGEGLKSQLISFQDAADRLHWEPHQVAIAAVRSANFPRVIEVDGKQFLDAGEVEVYSSRELSVSEAAAVLNVGVDAAWTLLRGQLRSRVAEDGTTWIRLSDTELFTQFLEQRGETQRPPRHRPPARAVEGPRPTTWLEYRQDVARRQREEMT